jgi:hypothetical protein
MIKGHVLPHLFPKGEGAMLLEACSHLMRAQALIRRRPSFIGTQPQ